jgi:hypothetical protein
MKIVSLPLCIAFTIGLTAGSAGAQTVSGPAQLSTAAPATTLVTPSFRRMLSDTTSDFGRLASGDSARWLVIGAAASLLARAEDAKMGDVMARPHLQSAFAQGQMIGSSPFQMGGALATYTIGRITGSRRTAQVGAELFRAQTVAQLTTYAMKYTFLRTRPDGTRFSFPSGHTSVAFASATVLQRNFGWKVGAPAYAVAAYVGGSRMQTRRHYLSDVAFGAVLGIVAGKNVTIGGERTRLAINPVAVPGGTGVTFSLMRR